MYVAGWLAGWLAVSLTACLAVEISPGSYSVSVMECADEGERTGRLLLEVVVLLGGGEWRGVGVRRTNCWFPAGSGPEAEPVDSTVTVE